MVGELPLTKDMCEETSSLFDQLREMLFCRASNTSWGRKEVVQGVRREFERPREGWVRGSPYWQGKKLEGVGNKRNIWWGVPFTLKYGLWLFFSVSPRNFTEIFSNICLSSYDPVGMGFVLWDADFGPGWVWGETWALCGLPSWVILLSKLFLWNFPCQDLRPLTKVPTWHE